MRRLLPLLLLFACRTSELGKCARDSDCASGSRCDLTQDTPVCVIAQSGCFPACATGQVCQNAVCVSTGCNPPCDSAHVCDTTTLTCTPVTTATVAITSPTGGFARGTLQATASAHAPGGVSAVRFELRRGAAVLAAADGRAMPAGGDAGNWAASLPLAGVPDGDAQLVAISGAVTSAAVSLVVDQTAPAITLVTDSSATLYAGGATASVTASINDGAGAGVGTAQLVVKGAPHPGTAGSNGQFTFSIALDDSVAPAGATTAVPYSIVATDRAGNAATLAGDPRETLRVDRDAPRITAIAVVTAPDWPGFYVGGPTPLTISAKIADGAGVANPCLRLAGETFCAHPGAAAGGAYTFQMPRSSTGDGTTPVDFVISADDALAAATPLKSEHHADSAPQHVYFDNAPPAVVIAADPQPWARTLPDGGQNLVTISALITDPSGLSGTPQLVSSGAQIAPSGVDGGLYTFQLNATDAPPGSEGSYSFSVTAQDNLNHVASVNGTRFIDDAPPAVLFKVYKDQEPGSGVAYPAAVANTGHTGSSFIYSDAVHVKGNVSDRGGLSRAVVHVDGLELDGGISTGVARPLGCAASTTSCDFDVTLPLNAQGNGAFHTGTNTVGFGGSTIPSGLLQISVDASDRAAAGDGSAAVNSSSNPLAARTTRFLFQTTLGGAVTGLAIHPAGEVIATTDGGTDTVYGLEADRPAVRWSFGADAGVAGLGAVYGPPAIDEGDSPNVFVASASGSVYAVSPAGAAVWHQDNLSPFSTGPVVTAPGTAVVPASDTGTLWTATAAGASQVATGGADRTSSPLVFNGGLFVGHANGLSRHAINASGTPGAAVTDTTNGGPFLSLATDGTRVLAVNSGNVIAVDQGLAQIWSQGISASGEPTIDLLGKAVLGDNSSRVLELDPLSGNPATLFTLPATKVARVALQGSDGHVYYPRSLRVLLAYDGTQLSWTFTPPSGTNNIWRAAAMDCTGRLYAAAANMVFAFVSDDRGLADTAWPNYRRDARNTGNASAPKYGIATAAGCRQ